ncbi:MAG: MFS transporter [Pseudomonadota bacterium]
MSILSAISLSKKPVPAFAAVGFFWGSLAASIPVIKTNLSVNDVTFGLLLLANAVGLVAAMWTAPWFDKKLGSRSLPTASALFACCFALPVMMPTPLTFTLAMLTMGIASGLTDVTMNARVSELEARHGRTLMNANHGIFSLGYAVAAFTMGLAREAGVPPVYVFLGFALIVLASTRMMYMEIEAAEPPEGSSKGKYPLGILLICGGVVLIAFMSEATVETWSALHIERSLGGRAAEGALGPTMLGLTMAIGRLGGQGLSDRFSDLRVISVAAVITALGSIVAALAATPFVAYMGFGLFGLGVSVIGPLGLAQVGRRVPPHLRTDAISKAAVMGFSGFFIAPVIMGGISEAASLSVAYLCVAGLVLLCLPLVLMLRARDT